MKNVCLFDFPPNPNFHGFRIETFDPWRYFPRRSAWGLSDLIADGLNGYDHRRALTLGAEGVDRLYRERNPHYMRLVDDFVEQFRDFDLIVMATFNFLHPEVLVQRLSRPTKVIGLIDDPLSTYQRGIPFLWAFDGAFYISPSYIDDLPFAVAIERWTSKPTMWWPLVPRPFERPAKSNDDFFRKRDVEIVYVGNPTGSKMDRLIRLKRHFGSRLRVHGRWRFGGYLGLARGLTGKAIYPHRVTSLTASERTQLYWRTKIGLNMHVSSDRAETGNARMYELPAHGVMMICDKAGAAAHELIFAPSQEAVYYDSLDDAIERIEHYLRDDEERVKVARNGFDRYWRDYGWENNLLRFLTWAASIRDDNER